MIKSAKQFYSMAVTCLSTKQPSPTRNSKAHALLLSEDKTPTQQTLLLSTINIRELYRKFRWRK